VRRTKEDAALTKEQLLKAALHSFHEKGYIATSLDDIARAAGATRGAVYWHFGSKAELFNAVVREQYTRAAAKLGPLYAQGGTMIETLRHVLVSWLSYAEEDRDFRTMLELTTLQTGLLPELAAGIQEKKRSTDLTIQGFATMIGKGITAGEVRPEVNPEVTARMALGMIYGITSAWLIDQSAFSLKDQAEEMIDIFLRGIAQAET
jgi:AcrR family transcriptional regulator